MYFVLLKIVSSNNFENCFTAKKLRYILHCIPNIAHHYFNLRLCRKIQHSLLSQFFFNFKIYFCGIFLCVPVINFSVMCLVYTLFFNLLLVYYFNNHLSYLSVYKCIKTLNKYSYSSIIELTYKWKYFHLNAGSTIPQKQDLVTYTGNHEKLLVRNIIKATSLKLVIKS